MDLAGELARLDKELAKLEKDVTAVNMKLSNESFVSRAPAEVVARERDSARRLLDAKRQKLQALRARFAEPGRRIIPAARPSRTGLRLMTQKSVAALHACF